jgi:hypothetical protein
MPKWCAWLLDKLTTTSSSGFEELARIYAYCKREDWHVH